MAGIEDPVAEHNREMWERLAAAGVKYTRPTGDPGGTPEDWRLYIDPRGVLDGVRFEGCDVLCLAAGGGWEPVLFARLGARTTLLDISPSQLTTVRDLAAVAKVDLKCLEGNMKDLSAFPGASFDLVWQNHSLLFVDAPEPVFREVARVLRPNSTYVTSTMHPFAFALYGTWMTAGYYPREYFREGPTDFGDGGWWDVDGVRVHAPTMEFAHTISRLVNGLADAGLIVDGLWERPRWDAPPEPDPVPGSDEHVESLVPAYLELRARKPKEPWLADTKVLTEFAAKPSARPRRQPPLTKS
jgi:SAM-dependent methyltransferase